MIRTIKSILIALCVTCNGTVTKANDLDFKASKLIVEQCLDCHSGSKPKGGLDLSTKSSATKGGDSGPGLIAQRPETSSIWEVIHSKRMPPKNKLTNEQTQLLKSWLKNGAGYTPEKLDLFKVSTSKRAGSDWWSLQPIQTSTPPNSKFSQLANNPIDLFVLKKLEENKVIPNPIAEKRTLIRRLYLDVTGLSPTFAEVESFQNAIAPDAYEKLVEMLLASPQYGEKWARHWLDVVRYGESDGFERNLPRLNAWHFRDWVIRSLNEDISYDHFARMQLAGDSFSKKESESAAAMGYLVAGIHNTVLGSTEESREQARQDELEDTIGTLGQTFLGLTVHCARCHDHKFDPIPQTDYYKLVASLSGYRHGEQTIINPEQSFKHRQFQESIAKISEEISRIDEPVYKKLGVAGLPASIQPMAEWDLQKGLQDLRGNLHLKLSGNAILTSKGLQLDGNSGVARTPILPFPVSEKTLEVVVQLNNLLQRGGGAITLQSKSGTFFDAIVFGEKEPGHWLAGSNNFQRTRDFQGFAEIDAQQKPVHLTITYQTDGTINAYRNGKPYGKPYKVSNVHNFNANDAVIALGLRHEPASGNHTLAGTIIKARLFTRALNAKEVETCFNQSGSSLSDSEIAKHLDQGQALKRADLISKLNQLQLNIKTLETTLIEKIYSPISQEPKKTFFLNRGQVGDRGIEIPPVYPSFLPLNIHDGNSGNSLADKERRKSLSDWITNNQNPLFARVIVNRIWHYHFGTGLVESPSDFGFNGGKPSHPELLDYLARELQQNNFSLKHIHRKILLSRTYMQSSKPNEIALGVDMDNRLLWRFSPRRLDAEVVRDSALFSAGELNQQMFGPAVSDYKQDFINGTTYFTPLEKMDISTNRRSVYRLTPRGANQGLLDALDCPDNSSATPKRNQTTTPTQSLALWNGTLIHELCDAIQRNNPSSLSAKKLFHAILQKKPSREELEASEIFIEKFGSFGLARVLLNSNEFLFLE